MKQIKKIIILSFAFTLLASFIFDSILTHYFPAVDLSLSIN